MSVNFLKVDKDLFNQGLNPTEILILAQIMEYNRTTGECFMSDKYFAEMLGVSESTISRSISSLEKKGLIKRDTKPSQKGKVRFLYATNSQNDACENSANSKMTVPEESNCLVRKQQNDLIKEKDEKKSVKEKLGNSPSNDGEFLQTPPTDRMIDNLSDSNGNFKF